MHPRKSDPNDAPVRPSNPPLRSGSFPIVRRSLEVLVVEDDEGVAGTMVEVLAAAGHRAAHARTLSAAREYVDAHHPDVITLDLQLDGEVGAELLAALAGRTSMPPIVIVSASSLTEGVADEHGVTFVRKPFDIDALTGAVERAARL